MLISIPASISLSLNSLRAHHQKLWFHPIPFKSSAVAFPNKQADAF
jgi:hypothetical protein